MQLCKHKSIQLLIALVNAPRDDERMHDVDDGRTNECCQYPDSPPHCCHLLSTSQLWLGKLLERVL